MGNITLPTPVVIVGGALAVLGGYLVGVVAGPDTPTRTTGEVESYDVRSKQLCLVGEAVSEQAGADSDGRLCGVWRRSAGSANPSVGDSFRFVTLRTAQAPGATEGEPADDPGDDPGEDPGLQAGGQVLIYGDVVD